jgi:hypothetical protein
MFDLQTGVDERRSRGATRRIGGIGAIDTFAALVAVAALVAFAAFAMIATVDRRGAHR